VIAIGEANIQEQEKRTRVTVSMPGCQGRIAGSYGKAKLQLLEATPIGTIALHRVGKEMVVRKGNSKPTQRFLLSCRTRAPDAAVETLVTKTHRLTAERVTEIETALVLLTPATAALTVADLENIISSTIATAGKEELSNLVRKNLAGSAMSNHNLFGKLKGEIMKKGFVVTKKKLKKEKLELILKHGAQALRLEPKELKPIEVKGRSRLAARGRNDDHIEIVHKDHPKVKSKGMRSVTVEKLMEAAEEGEQRAALGAALEVVKLAVAGVVGHRVEEINHLAVLGSWSGMAAQRWHIDALSVVGFLVPLVPCWSTVFLRPAAGFAWKLTSAMKTGPRAAFCKRVFEMTAADGFGVADGCGYERVWLKPGDILSFYTHWVHRSPLPPTAGKPARVVLFGDFGKDSGAPLFRAEALEPPEEQVGTPLIASA
jgi:hypothetical protein